MRWILKVLLFLFCAAFSGTVALGVYLAAQSLAGGFKAQRLVETAILAPPTGSGDFIFPLLMYLAVYGLLGGICLFLLLTWLGRPRVSPDGAGPSRL